MPLVTLSDLPQDKDLHNVIKILYVIEILYIIIIYLDTICNSHNTAAMASSEQLFKAQDLRNVQYIRC